MYKNKIKYLIILLALSNGTLTFAHTTNVRQTQGLELGDNSYARGKGSVVTSENGVAIGNGSVATGGDNLSGEDIRKKLKENEDKLKEISDKQQEIETLTNEITEKRIREHETIEAGIRVEELRKAKSNAQEQANQLKLQWEIETNNSENFFKEHQAKIDDLNSRLTGVGNLTNKDISSEEGLQKAVTEFKEKVEKGTTLNLSNDFYKDYITTYYKALGDLRIQEAYLSLEQSNEQLKEMEQNGVTLKKTDDLILDKNEYGMYDSLMYKSTTANYFDNSSSAYVSTNKNNDVYKATYYNYLGSYYLTKDNDGRIWLRSINWSTTYYENGENKSRAKTDDMNGYFIEGKYIKTYIDINKDLTTREQFEDWNNIKDKWKARRKDFNKRIGNELIGKIHYASKGKSTVLYDMVTDMKFELVDLEKQITYYQFEYEKTKDSKWLDKKKIALTKREECLKNNETKLKEKAKELGYNLNDTSRLNFTIAEKWRENHKKENIDPIKEKNKITTEKLTAELEQALGINKNAILEREAQLKKMKEAYEQAQRNADGINPSEKDLILSREYERVKKELEQLNEKLVAANARLKALKDALTLHDLKNKGKDNFAHGTNALAVGNDAYAIGTSASAIGDQTLSIGKEATTIGKKSGTIGVTSTTNGENSYTLGNENIIYGNGNITIGNMNKVGKDKDNIVNDNIVIGSNIISNVNNAIVLGNSSTPVENAVSIGYKDNERQIKFVKSGTDDTDAVNYSQLKSYVGAELGKITLKQGSDGKSAYEIWKELQKKTNPSIANNELTEYKFLNSLKGKDGKDGTSSNGIFEYILDDEYGKDVPKTKIVRGEDGKLYKYDDIKGKTYNSTTGYGVEDVTTKVNYVSVATKPMVIGNISDGSISENSKEAVNGGQLYTVNKKIDLVDKKVDLATEKSNLAISGVSNAIAVASLPQINGDYRHNISAAYGYYGNSHAVAVGMSGTTEKKNFMYKINASVNNKGNIGIGIGMGYMFSKQAETSVKDQIFKRLSELDKKYQYLEKENETRKKDYQIIQEMLGKLIENRKPN